MKTIMTEMKNELEMSSIKSEQAEKRISKLEDRKNQNEQIWAAEKRKKTEQNPSEVRM